MNRSEFLEATLTEILAEIRSTKKKKGGDHVSAEMHADVSAQGIITELEASDQRAVRDNINSGRSLLTGGEPKQQQYIRQWLKQKDVERISREQRGFDYAHWTFYVAVSALIVAIVGMVVTVLLA